MTTVTEFIAILDRIHRVSVLVHAPDSSQESAPFPFQVAVDLLWVENAQKSLL